MPFAILRFQLRIIPSKTTQSCAVTPSGLSGGKAAIRTFDSRSFGLSQAGIYTLYRHRALPVEVQAHFRPCSLGALCTCAVGVRVDDVITILDVCTKGHLQVGAMKVDSFIQGDPSARRLDYVDISSVSYQSYPESELMPT